MWDPADSEACSKLPPVVQLVRHSENTAPPVDGWALCHTGLLLVLEPALELALELVMVVLPTAIMALQLACHSKRHHRSGRGCRPLWLSLARTSRLPRRHHHSCSRSNSRSPALRVTPLPHQP